MKHSPYFRRLLAFWFSLFSLALSAQTDTLVSPSKEGGFELGNGSLAANGWTIASNTGTQANQWTANKGAQAGFHDTYCAYISNQPSGNPPLHQFTPQQGSTVHLYRDVTFPKGRTQMYISFSCFNPNQAPVRVALVSRDSDLTTGITMGSYGGFNYYGYFGSGLDMATIGNCNRDTTWRLVFSWTVPTDGTIQPPPAIDDVNVYAHAPVSLLRGTDSIFTIDKTRATAGTNFKSINAAIGALSEYSFLCIPPRKLIFNVAAGQVFDEQNQPIRFSGTATAPIIFQKSGTGANPIIKPKITDTNNPSGLFIKGGDYLTFDGIDVDGRTDSAIFITSGYRIENASNTNGAQNNTIKNCTITLDSRGKVDWIGTVGIFQNTRNFFVASPTAANSRNRFLNVNIYNCYKGISVTGSDSNPDSLIEIGSTDPRLFSEIGQTNGDDIENAGIILFGCANFSIHHVKSNMPFYSNYSSGAKNRIFNNKIITQKGDCALTLSGYATSTDIFNNFLSMTRAKTRNSSYDVERAVIKIQEFATTPVFNIYNNSLFIDESLATSGIYRSSCFSNYYNSKAHLLNNVLVNLTNPNSVNGSKQYCITSTTENGFTSNYNAFWRIDTTTKIGFLTATNLNDWRTTTLQDANSVVSNPLFLSPTDLHAYGLGIDGKGTTPPNGLTVDIDNETRTAPFDIGADQFMRQPTDLAIADLIEPNDSNLILCNSRQSKIRVAVKNLGSQTINFAQNIATIKVIVTRPNRKDTLSMAVNTGTLLMDSVKIVDVANFSPDSVGVYLFQISTSTVGDVSRQNDSAVFERRLIAPSALPFIEPFYSIASLNNWTIPASMGLYSRGKEGSSLSAYLSNAKPNQIFQLPKLAKITDTSTLLNFDYRLVTVDFTGGQNSALPNTPSWGNIQIQTSTDCGMTFTNLRTIDATNHQVSVDYQTISMPLSTFIGKEVVFRFILNSTTASPFFFDFDNFAINTPCRRLTGKDSIAFINPLNPIKCVGAEVNLLSKLGYNDKLGIKYEWQYSLDTSQTWQKLNSPFALSFGGTFYAKTYPIFYRLKTICTIDNSNLLSNAILVKPENLPTVAQLPYKESFENWKSSACIPAFSTNDLPTSAWNNYPSYGDKSWRRNDGANSGSWSYFSSTGDYTPTATAGQYSARFHSVGMDANNYPIPAFDLNIDLSSAITKQLGFDYLNLDGNDGLQVSLSSDGGITFMPIDTPLSTTTSWRRFKYNLPANGSAKSVLRFEGIRTLNPNIYYNTTDIGLDSLTIENATTAPPCIALTSPQNGSFNAQDDQLLTWQAANFATGYRIKIGTTTTGSEVLPLTDIGFVHQYRSPNFFDYQKKYFVTLVPYNAIGAAQGCSASSFTVGSNINYGGGRDGQDTLQPLAGGYRFANSTTAATTAPIGKAVYGWVDPSSHFKVPSFLGSGDNRDGYYATNLLFRFPFYTSNNAINLSSNGLLSIEYGVPSYYSNKTIPSNSDPYYGIIAACYAQLYRGADSKMYVKNDSTQFVATWWHFYATKNNAQDTSEYITFQIILKPDGSIKIQYNADESSVGRLASSQILQTALVGIEGYYGQNGVQYRNKGRGARIFDAQNKSLAIDFKAPVGDLAVYDLKAPHIDSRCMRDIYPIVNVFNRSIGTMDFARNPATIVLKMTGMRSQTLTYTINSGTLITNANREYQFSAPLSMDTLGDYNFEITVKNALDDNPSNDTARTVRTIEGTATTLPYFDDFNATGQYNDGNDKGYNRYYSGSNVFQSPAMRLRKGDYLAFDYRLLGVFNFQPATLLSSNDWDKVQIGYTTDCGANFTVLDSITPTTHSPTFYWRQKTLRIPDSLAGKFVKFQILFFNRLSYAVVDIDNFYVGRACDSATIDIGNITAPPSVCQGDAVRAGVFQRPIAPFIQYKWQYSTNNGTSWSALTGAEGNNYILPQTNITATYRVIGTCSLTQKSDTTDPKLITAYTPQYAALPYSQSFENWQTSSCNNSSFTNDIPDDYWLNLPQSGSGSWRRNDQNSLGNWLNNADGAYTPTSSQGSYSARFHSSVPYPPVQGSLNLFVNLSGTTDKTLSFDYLNKNGADSLSVSWSTDNGATFIPLSTLRLSAAWTPFSFALVGGTAKSIIRFEGINRSEQYGRDDIGLDNVRVFANNFNNDAAIAAISPQSFGCQNTVQPLTVKLRNAGLGVINLVATPITVNVTVSGALSRSFTKAVNTGSLAVGGTLDVPIDPSFTLSSFGLYTIDASLVSAADSNTTNNTLKTQVRVASETTVPFNQNFDNNPNFPIGWLTDGSARMDTSWRYNGNFKIGFNMNQYDYTGLDNKGGTIILPKMGVLRADDVLSFDTRISRNYLEILPNGVDWGSVEAFVSDDCGQTWTSVWVANSTNFVSSTNFVNLRLSLSRWVGKSIIVRLLATYKTDSYFIGFDNFSVDKKCVGAPTIAAITGNAALCKGETTTLQTTLGSGSGLSWLWQKQDSIAWITVDSNKNSITTPSLFASTKYRVVATCLLDSSKATSNPFAVSVNQPTYARLPYYQDFETWQSPTCATSSSAQALPDASWLPQFYTGNNAWRRNDNGANAAWTNPTSGIYTPLSTTGNFSARFHSTQAAFDATNNMDLYVDMSSSTGTKYLAFDYINLEGVDGLTLYVSKDGGRTFDFIEQLSAFPTGWQRVEWAINSNSANTIIRFFSRNYPSLPNSSDVGIDNLSITTRPLPNCVNMTTPLPNATNVYSDVVMRWDASAGAKGYKIKIGTTPLGSDFTSLTDVGTNLFYKPTQKFGFLTNYYVTVIAYDSVGNGRTNCSVPFMTQRNPNFGGGANGNDPSQPMSGGYFFANSTAAAAAALPSQPRYVWIAPLSNNHTAITNWTLGNSDNGSFTLPDIGFNFSFYGTNYRSNIFVNSNGALHFGAANTATGANEFIPNSATPNNFIAACWMDLAAGNDGKVYYGKSATGEYVVTWWHYHDVAPNGSVDTAEYITFQAILNPNGTIKVQFNDVESTADDGRLFDILDDALIGIEDAAGSMGIQYRNNGGPAPMFSSPLAVAFAVNNKLLPIQNPVYTEGVTVGDAFPNPSSNQFSFDFYTPQKMVLTLQLSNSLGQKLWSESYTAQLGWQQKTVDWQNSPAGIYWLSVLTEQGHRFVQRVVRN